MKSVVTAVAVLVAAVAVTGAQAQNVDSKDCLYLKSHAMVQLGDIVVKQGEVARPTFAYKVDAWLDKQYGGDVWVDLTNTYCIEGDCRTDKWPNGYVRPLYGYHSENMGTLDIGHRMLTKGTFNSTYRLRSGTLGCDVTAVGTIFVQ